MNPRTILALSLAIAAAPAQTADTIPSAQLKALDECVTALARADRFSGIVAVAKHGRILSYSA